MTLRARRLARLLTLAAAVGAAITAAVVVEQPTSPARPRATKVAPTARPTTTPSPTPRPTVPPHWVEVSLGDSVPAGSACDCAPFPAVYAHRITARTGASVEVHNLGTPGQTSAGLVAALAQPSWARVLARADIVTVTIGANDFAFATFQRGHCGDLRCYAPQLAALRRNLDTTLTTIATLRRGRPTAVRLTGYWDIWRDGQVARAQGATYARVGRRLTARVNAVIASVAAAHHVPFVDLVAPFRGSDGDSDDTGLLASDGDHPNNAGHQVIAATLMLLGLAPLLSG